MVNINLTFFIQLVLFLVFLWGANRIALRPILRVLDKREDTIRDQEDTAEQEAEKAARLEAEYASAMQDTRREASVRQMQARRAAMDERATALTARHREADEAIAALHDEAARQVEAERPKYAPLVASLAHAVEDRLNLKVLER
jgi:F-type H+-transporting ATPase subunit b